MITNFEQMYENIYSYMVTKHVAILLPEPVFFDKEGKQVLESYLAYGHKTQYQLTRHELVFFVDKVGDNMSQKHDGNINEEKFIIAKDGRALTHSSMNDCHFMILNFTAPMGEPLCCTIIIAAQKMNALVPLGPSTMGRC